MNVDKQAIREAVEAALEQRLASHGFKPGSKSDLKEQAAFVAGASVALHAVFGKEGAKTLTDYVPAWWVVSCMTGRSITQERTKDRAKSK